LFLFINIFLIILIKFQLVFNSKLCYLIIKQLLVL
jgi:hypothetical protein